MRYMECTNKILYSKAKDLNIFAGFQFTTQTE